MAGLALRHLTWHTLLTALVVLITTGYADAQELNGAVTAPSAPSARQDASGHGDDPIALVSRTAQDTRESVREPRAKRASSPIRLTTPVRSLPAVVGHTTTQDESAPLPANQLAFIVSPSRDPPTRG